MSWYNDWFNSEYYLKVYSHRDESEAERLVELITKKVELSPGSNVLDMACGSGRHAIIFAKKGFNVTAVDLSNLLISEAKDIATESEVKIQFVLSDILKFKSEKQYNLVLNLFTSFGYFDDDEENFKVIQKAYELTAKNGFFVLDYFNKNYLLSNLIPTTIFSENGCRITQYRTIQGNRVRKNISVESKDSYQEFYESVRLYSHQEMLGLMKKAGFKIIATYGDYDGNLFNEENSPRLILITKK